METVSAEAGFREIDHTADWELELWAPDLEGVMEEAARGMYDLCGLTYGGEVQASRRFEIDQPDRETLLVRFLSECLYHLQTDQIAFERFDFEFRDGEEDPLVSVFAMGRPVDTVQTEIKAVTWHNVAVDETEDGYTGRVTFDV
ncbi:MAG: archease [Bradymonadaceae bacterium]